MRIRRKKTTATPRDHYTARFVAPHALRDESDADQKMAAADSLFAQFGIEVARQNLGHWYFSTTSAHYVSKKACREVSLTYGAIMGRLRAVEATV